MCVRQLYPLDRGRESAAHRRAGSPSRVFARRSPRRYRSKTLICGMAGCLPRSARAVTIGLTAAPSRRERLAQVVVGDLRQRLAAMRAAASASGARAWRAGRAAQRGLPEPQSADRLPAEEAVDPLQDHAATGAGFRSPSGLRPAAPAWRARGSSPLDGARPLHLLRLRMGGDLRPDDLGPAGDEFGRRRSPACAKASLERACAGGRRAGAATCLPGLFMADAALSRRTMTVAADA